jgi:uncharacterized cupredoxin-like copper-binding protein
MNRHFGYLAAVILPMLVTSAAAAEATVKVALTDISSAMGMGPGGRGVMGQGMMSPGAGGQGWSRPGMMGGGMMAVRIDQPSVKAGTINFDVVNWSRGMVHEMLIVAVDDPQAPLPYDYWQAKVVEDQVKVLGDTGELRPNQSYTLDVTLAAGSYLLVCNVSGHYAAGMVAPLTVTP